MRDLVFIACKWVWEMVLILLVAVGAGLAYLLFLHEPVYEAQARLFVRVAQEQAPPPTLITQDGVTFLSQPNADILSEIDLLRSHELVQRLIDATQLEVRVTAAALAEAMAEPNNPWEVIKYWVRDIVRTARERVDQVLYALDLKQPLSVYEALRLRLQESLLVESEPNSNVIIVTLFWPVKEEAAELLNVYINIYQNYRNEVFRRNGNSEVEFFADRLGEVHADLSELEQRLADFERNKDIHSLGEQKGLLISELARARAELFAAEQRLALNQQRAQQVRAAEDVLNIGEVEPNSVASGLAAQLIELQRQRAALLITFHPKAPDARANLTELTSVRTALLNNLSEAVEERRREVDSLRARRDTLAAELKRLSASELGWRRLRRQFEIQEERYGFNAERLEEARSIAALRDTRISNITVVQPAQEPIKPVGQRNMFTMGLVGVLGGFAAVAWAALREFFDQRLYTADDVRRKLGLEALAVLPEDRVLGASWRRLRGGVRGGAGILRGPAAPAAGTEW